MVGWIGLTVDEWDAVRGLYDESDRAAAIMSAALLEDRLEKKIRQHVRQSSAKHDRAYNVLANIFRPSGPLGNFSIKIQFGYLLRIYDEIVLRELDTIKDIRNLFAHELTIRSFGNTRVKDLCNNLRILERYFVEVVEWQSDPMIPVVHGTIHHEIFYATPKMRYINACATYASLLQWFRDSRMPPILGDGPIPSPDRSGQRKPRRSRPSDPGRKTPKAQRPASPE